MSDVINRLRQLAELYPFLGLAVEAAIDFTERNELRRGQGLWGVGEDGELPYIQVNEQDLVAHTVSIGWRPDYFTKADIKMVADMIPNGLRQEFWRIQGREIVVTGYLSKYHGITIIKLPIMADYDSSGTWSASIEQFDSLESPESHSEFCPVYHPDSEDEDSDWGCCCEPHSIGFRRVSITHGESLDLVKQHFTQFLEDYL